VPSADDETGSLWQRCWYHRVCHNLVLPGEGVCDTCRAAWGALLAPATPPVGGSAATPIPADSAVASVESAAPVEKRGQRCWLCEQRRSCVLVAGNWECRACRAVTG